jgi:VanZ family protein
MLSLLDGHSRNLRLWQIALAGYWLALFIGTHVPVEQLALNRISVDKLLHIAAFTGLALLLATTWRLSAGQFNIRHGIAVWILAMLYGAIDESTQPLVNRSASLLDWFADGIGALLGLVIFWLWSDRWMNNLVPASDVTSDGDWPRTWPRYSLKTLFVAMTLVALTCYWMMLPTINAQRFVRAIQERDYAAADNLFIDENRFFEAAQTTEALGNNPILSPLTWRELWTGHRHISLPMNAEAGGEYVHFLVNRQGVKKLLTSA